MNYKVYWIVDNICPIDYVENIYTIKYIAHHTDLEKSIFGEVKIQSAIPLNSDSMIVEHCIFEDLKKYIDWPFMHSIGGSFEY